MYKLYKVTKTIEYVLAAPEDQYEDADTFIDADGMSVSTEYDPIINKDDLPEGWTLNSYPFGNDCDKTVGEYFE